MPRQGYKPRGTYGTQTDDAARLREALGSGGTSGGWQLDPQLCSVLVQTVTAKGGAIQFGTSKDGTQLTIKVFLGGIPTQRYCESIQEAHKVMGATICVLSPSGSEYDELRAWAEGYWKTQ